MNIAQLGIGVDIEDIARFRKLDFSRNRNFYQKIFHKNEIRYCLNRQDPPQHFAARFCAKEAFIKANQEKVKNPAAIEVKVKNKKPYILWHKKKYLLSLSHTKDKAIAFVITENGK